MSDEIIELTNHNIRAAKMLLDYDRMQENVAGLIDSADVFTQYFLDRPGEIAPYAVAVPTIESCQRRLLTLAAAMKRLANSIERKTNAR